MDYVEWKQALARLDCVRLRVNASKRQLQEALLLLMEAERTEADFALSDAISEEISRLEQLERLAGAHWTAVDGQAEEDA